MFLEEMEDRWEEWDDKEVNVEVEDVWKIV